MVASVPDDTSLSCCTAGTLAMISSASSDLARAGRAERQSATGRRLHGVHHRRVGVAQDHRTPGADEIDVLPTVRIGEPGAPGRTP